MIYEFMATQDLHGWGKPWAPGANINLLPPAASMDEAKEVDMIIQPYPDGHYHVKKTAGAASRTIEIEIADLVSVVTDEIYFTPIAAASGSSRVILGYDSNNVNLFGNTYYGISSTVAVHDGDMSKLRFYLLSTTNGEWDVYPMLTTDALESSTDISLFTPYANICMPEGFDIWDPYNAEFIQVYAGYVNTNTRELFLRPVYQEYAGEELVGPWMSSWDPYEEDTTPTEGAFVIDFGGELTSFEISPFMLQTLLDSLGIRQHFTDGAGLLNSLMDQAQGRVRSEEELLHLSRPLKVIPIGDQLPAGLKIRPISKDVLPGLPGKFIR